MGAVIHWFRRDLRLSDHPALRASCASALAQGLPWLPVFNWDPAQLAPTRWVPQRMGPLRRLALHQALTSLDCSLRHRGHRLHVVQGDPAEAITRLMAETGATELWGEHLPAPEEESVDEALRAEAQRAGWRCELREQGGLLDLARLPFSPGATPDVFTAFRLALERAGTPTEAPVAEPESWPAAMPDLEWEEAGRAWPPALSQAHREALSDVRASVPLHDPSWHIGESQAWAHWARYLVDGAAHSYKATRNGLHGARFSTKLSPWLAWGAISARQALHALTAWEAKHGASDGSRWITFELLWREHFRLMHHKHGRKLFRARGLGQQPAPVHDEVAFDRWCRGQTGQPLVDAGMRELRATGWMSNRLRQVVASHLIHDLGCDWRAGAAWFESCLIDFDVFSNQGNWAYIAGRGTDPRGGRRFDPDKQAREHDPAGEHRRRWSAP